MPSTDPWKYTEETQPESIPVSLMSTFAGFMAGDHLKEQLHGTTMVRKMLCVDENVPVKEALAEGCVESFIKLLKRQDSNELQFQSAWALTQVFGTGGDTPIDPALAKSASTNLIGLLASDDEECRDQAAWALANLAGRGVAERDECLDNGAILPMLALYSRKDQSIETQQRASWALANLCRGRPAPKVSKLVGVPTALANMIASADKSIVSNGAWTMANLTDMRTSEMLQLVFVHESAPRLVELLYASGNAILEPTVRVISNICGHGTKEQRQQLLDAGVLIALAGPLRLGKIAVKREACWVVNCLLRENVKAVIDANIIPAVVDAADTTEFVVRREAGFALALATHLADGTMQVTLYKQGVLDRLCRFLGASPDLQLMDTLEAVDLLLEVHSRETGMGSADALATPVGEEGLAELEQLENHSSEAVAQHAELLKQRYFRESTSSS